MGFSEWLWAPRSPEELKLWAMFTATAFVVLAWRSITDRW